MGLGGRTEPSLGSGGDQLGRMCARLFFPFLNEIWRWESSRMGEQSREVRRTSVPRRRAARSNPPSLLSSFNPHTPYVFHRNTPFIFIPFFAIRRGGILLGKTKTREAIATRATAPTLSLFNTQLVCFGPVFRDDEKTRLVGLDGLGGGQRGPKDLLVDGRPLARHRQPSRALQSLEMEIRHEEKERRRRTKSS